MYAKLLESDIEQQSVCCQTLVQTQGHPTVCSLRCTDLHTVTAAVVSLNFVKMSCACMHAHLGKWHMTCEC